MWYAGAFGCSWTVVDYNDQRWQWILPQAATGVGLVVEGNDSHDVIAERCEAISRKSSAAEVCGQILLCRHTLPRGRMGKNSGQLVAQYLRCQSFTYEQLIAQGVKYGFTKLYLDRLLHHPRADVRK